MFRLAKYLKPFRKQVILGPIFKMIEAAFELIVPLVMASLIDEGIRGSQPAYILKMGGLLFLLGAVGLAASLTCQFYASRASQGFGTVVRSRLFAHINTLSHSELDHLGIPSLITRLNNDVNQLQLAVAMLIRLVFRAPFLAIGATIMAMTLDFSMALIFFFAAILISLALYLVMSRSIPYYNRIQGLLDRVSTITRENLSGVRVIRAFSRQDRERRRFAEANDELMDASVRVSKLSALLNPVTSAIANGGVIALVWYGGLRVNVGTLTQGQVIALWNYMNQVLLALIVVANLVVIFTKASASARRVNEVFDTLPSVSDRQGKAIVGDDSSASMQTKAELGSDSAASRQTKAEFDSDSAHLMQTKAGLGDNRVVFEDVSFSYHKGGKDCLAHINFTAAVGETIGIIGGTGSGKSSLINLIPRFYDVSSGRVLVDGRDVRDYPMKTLRAKIGMVPQSAMVFSGTIRDNLLWGDETASDDQLFAALKTAQAWDFVQSLPDGLDTCLQQGGKNLSGGQKQRLTIARALVKRPSILILDDSASALDFATDAALRRALETDTENMTVFMVSQRVNTVRDADRILVLDDSGRLAGIGSHETLYANCPIYQEICLSQLSREEAQTA